MPPSDLFPKLASAPPSLPSLDPLESPYHQKSPEESTCPGQIELTAVAFRHSGWSKRREQIHACLEGTRQSRFADCGRQAWILQGKEDPQKLKIAANLCKDRLCQVCNQERAQTIRENLGPWIKGKILRLLTLTIRSTSNHLGDEIDRLYDAWLRLRTKTHFKHCFKGGIAVLEVTYTPYTRPTPNGEKGRFHPHLHVLFEGRFMAQHDLSATWLKLTKDSQIVDIRMAKGPAAAIGYLLKYVTKGLAIEAIREPEVLLEFVHGLADRKAVMTFGTWRKLRLLTPHTTGEWTFLMPLDKCLHLARDGDERAKDIIHQLVAEEQFWNHTTHNQATPAP